MKRKKGYQAVLFLVLAVLLVLAGCGGGAVDDQNNGNINGTVEDDNNGSGNAAAAGCWDYQPVTMAPKPGWDTVDLEGLTREELVDVLGCPPHVIRMTSVVSADNNRELWVYHPYEEDPTGLFIWIKGELFHYSTLDEFNGFWCYEMTNVDFWE